MSQIPIPDANLQAGLPPPPETGVFSRMLSGFSGIVALHECTQLWQQAWSQVSEEIRTEFATRLLNFALHHAEDWFRDVLRYWSHDPDLARWLFEHASPEQRTATAEAFTEYALKQLQDHSWSSRDLVREVMVAVAKEQMQEVYRRETLDSLKGKPE